MSGGNQQRELPGKSQPISDIIYMTVDDQRNFAARLQTELQEFRERERMYVEKRAELQELEMKYRKKQDAMVGISQKYKQKFSTNDDIIANLKEQIAQNQRLLDSQNDDNEDMEVKISTQRDNITRRDNEVLELRDKIKQKAHHSNDLRRVLDQLAIDQKLLLEEKQVDEESVEQARQIREMRKSECDDYSTRLRKVKNDNFILEERNSEIIRVQDSKIRERTAVEEELKRVQNKLQQNQEQLSELHAEKQKLDNVLRCHSGDAHSMGNQKKLLEESNRRLQTGVSDLRKKVADVENLIANMNTDMQQLKSQNDFREQENDQLQDDMHSLEQHLNILEDQNRVLEQELENFVSQDEMIQNKLENRSRSRSPIKQVEISSYHFQRSNMKSRDQQDQNLLGASLHLNDQKGSKSFYDPNNSRSMYGNQQLGQSTATTKHGTAFKEDYTGYNHQTPYDKNQHQFTESKSFFDSVYSPQTDQKQQMQQSHALRTPNHKQDNQSQYLRVNKENDEMLGGSRYVALRDRSRSGSPQQQQHLHKKSIVKFADEQQNLAQSQGYQQKPNVSTLHPRMREDQTQSLKNSQQQPVQSYQSSIMNSTKYQPSPNDKQNNFVLERPQQQQQYYQDDIPQRDNNSRQNPHQQQQQQHYYNYNPSSLQNSSSLQQTAQNDLLQSSNGRKWSPLRGLLKQKLEEQQQYSSNNYAN